MALAFLNLGPSEILLLLVLMLVFFGVDRLPQMARTLGKAKGELDRARRQLARALEDEEGRMLSEQLSFEAQREHQIKEQHLAVAYEGEPTDEEIEAVRNAATALGLETEGKTVEQLRAMIAARVAQP